MSAVDNTGGGELQRAFDDIKRGHDADVAAEEQLSLLDPLSPEEMLDARQELGPNAGTLTVLRHARERRRGRPPGSKNKRSDDFSKYLLQFGQDPMIGAMRLVNTPPEVLVENSRREFVKYIGKEQKRVVWTAPTMTYGDALSHIARARELLAPYLHSKKPVSVDHTIRGVDVIEEAPRQQLAGPVDGEFIDVMPEPGAGGGAAK